ncbi:DUF4419 domain-containing protein [Nocardia sp. NPDC058058]|uniref:DUF4419 domain-containing protein n=1 Tax=Nocardia sp. NPDC058058 TaxID=3346317 RepID=UPI0036DB5AD3
MQTFPIDDVTPAAEALPTRPLGELFPDALVLGGDPALPMVEPNGVHPLLAAVGRAFAEHRPLVLSPDAVWLTIAQGIAQHIRLHAEELRPLLVRHAGRKRLEVVLGGGLPRSAEIWQGVVESWSKLLAAEIEHADLFECDFTTSSEVDRVAGRVVLLDAYSPYYSLWMSCVCGIPSLTLTGTADDWRKIRSRVGRLGEFGLGQWVRSLEPIADQFVRAATGDVDTAFWQRIYNPADAYGGEVITGWIARLYPYLVIDSAPKTPNHLLDLPIAEPRDLTGDDAMGYFGPGVRSTSIPATLSKVIVNVNDRVAGENRALALYAGLVGITQDDDGSLRPVAGWHLATAAVEIDDVIDRIIRDHTSSPPTSDRRNIDGCAELQAIYRRIGSATLFDGRWRLLSARVQRYVSEHAQPLIVESQRHIWDDAFASVLTQVFELPDGLSICARTDFRTDSTHWVRCRLLPDEEGVPHRVADAPADIPVYGTSLALLLDAALDSGGDIAHLETGTLADLL